MSSMFPGQILDNPKNPDIVLVGGKMSNLTRFIRPPGTRALPDNEQWTSRFEIHSESSDRVYIVAQNKSSGLWGCSCPGYRTHRTCKHLQHLDLPTPPKLLSTHRAPRAPERAVLPDLRETSLATRKRKPAPKAKGFMDGYRTYDTSGGRGSATDWEAAFAARMGVGTARRVVGRDSPAGILGVSADARWSEIKSAYRSLVRIHHPDVGGKAEDFRRIQAAFEVLESQYRP